MKRQIFRSVFATVLLAAMISSITGCYYDDDHDHHWRDSYGRYHYDRDDYGYRRGYDRDDYWWRGRDSHDHDRDDD